MPGRRSLIHPTPASLCCPLTSAVASRLQPEHLLRGWGEKGLDSLAQQGWVQAQGLLIHLCSYTFEGLKENQRKNGIWGLKCDKSWVSVFARLMAYFWVSSTDTEWAGGWRRVPVKPYTPSLCAQAPTPAHKGPESKLPGRLLPPGLCPAVWGDRFHTLAYLSQTVQIRGVTLPSSLRVCDSAKATESLFSFGDFTRFSETHQEPRVLPTQCLPQQAPRSPGPPPSGDRRWPSSLSEVILVERGSGGHGCWPAAVLPSYHGAYGLPSPVPRTPGKCFTF